MFIFVFYFACAIIPFVAVCMIIVGIIKIIKHSVEAKSVIEQGQDAMIEFLNNENLAAPDIAEKILTEAKKHTLCRDDMTAAVITVKKI